MALKDIYSATKFVKVFAGNHGAKVHFKDGLKVPHADSEGNIYVTPPNIGNLKEWLWHIHHELGHVMPEHKFHMDAVGLVMAGVPGGQRPLNIVVDNISERFEYERYEGRRDILCQGRFEYIKEHYDEIFPEPRSPEEEVILGMRAWDIWQRTQWMGPPFNLMKSPRDKYKDFIEYLDDNELETLMDNARTPEDLVNITQMIVDYIKKPKDDNKGDDNDSGDSPDEGTQDDKQADGNGSSSDDSSPDSDASDSAGDDNDVSPSDQQADGKDGSEPSDSSVGDDDDAGDGAGDSSIDDDENVSQRQNTGDTDDDDSGNDQDGVQEGSPEEQKDPSDDGRTDGDGSDSQGSPDSGGRPDSEAQDDSDNDSGGRQVEPTKAVDIQWDDDKLGRDVKNSVDGYLMKHGIPMDRWQAYEPYMDADWKKLSKPSAFRINSIEKMCGKSKVTKKIKKYLQASAQTSYAYGQRSGRLSSRSVFKAGQGGCDIFKRKQSSRIETNACMSILLDCSLSMNDYDGTGSNTKLDTAMASIAILADTLHILGIPFEVLGFTEDNFGLKMIEFCKFGENLNKAKTIKRLSSIPYQQNNADAEAVSIAASRLNMRREKKRMLLVLSDGNPIGFFDKGAAQSYLKKVCMHIEQDTNMELMAIGLHTDSVKSYYTNYEVVSDVAKLDGVLMTLLKNKVLK